MRLSAVQPVAAVALVTLLSCGPPRGGGIEGNQLPVREHPLVTAYAVLHGSARAAEPAGPITSKNVHRYVADPDVRRRAKARLSRLGFSVLRLSEFAVRISAPRKRFEDVFRAPILAEAGNLEGDLRWGAPPIVPPLLKGLVDDIVFQQTAIPLPGNPSDGGMRAPQP